MKASSTLAIASGLAALGASAMPASYPSFKRASAAPAFTTTQVLQYALTLENLENAFYSGALSQFDEAAFEAAGYPSWVRGRFSQIASHEMNHVSLLSGALGNDSVAACEYSFPYTDVTSFINLAIVLENVGVSAYAGAAQYIDDASYLTIAAVILSTEARHQAWESSAVANGNPWGSPYDTPLGLDMVYTLASAFITSCPASNPALPLMASPALTVTAEDGGMAQFTFDDPHTVANYAIFYSGIGSSAVMLDSNDMAAVPAGLQGITYVLISTSSTAAGVTSDNVVAGPAIMDSVFSAWVENPPFTG